MKIESKVKEILLDLGVTQNTINIFNANCGDLALEMLNLYADLKKDDDLQSKESREAIVEYYVIKNPAVEYVKKEVISEPEIVESEEFILSEEASDELNYLSVLSPEALKRHIMDEIEEKTFEEITLGELSKDEVLFYTPEVVRDKMEKYFIYWERELASEEDEKELNPNYRGQDWEYEDTYSYMPYRRNLFQQSPEDRFNNSIQSDIRFVMDYIDNPISSKGLGGKIEDQTFEELESASILWHRSLNQVQRIQLVPTNKGDDIVSDIDSKETHQIVIDYRQNEKGYYWSNLDEHFSAQEQRRMSHCGHCMHTLYSFRSILDATEANIPDHEDVTGREELFSDGKPEGHTVSRSHFTVSLGNDGIIYQMKAAGNKKVPAEFHKYVVDLLLAKDLPILGGKIEKIKGFGFEYDNGNDFTLSQIRDAALVKKLYEQREDLFTDGPRNISDQEMEDFMVQFNLEYTGPSKEKTKKYNFWEKPENYQMTEREKKQQEEFQKFKTQRQKDEMAEEPTQVPWFKKDELEDTEDNFMFEDAEYVYVLVGGEEKKFPCFYNPKDNTFFDVDDDELFASIETGDIKDTYILYKGRKINDAEYAGG